MLYRVLATALIALLPAPLMLHADDAAKVPDKDLEGMWEVVRSAGEGKGDRVTFAFKGDTLIWVVKPFGIKFTFMVEATKAPRSIDIVPADPEKGKAMKGIYEVRGDELRLCAAQGEKERPTEFSSNEERGWVLLSLKRVKE